MIGWTWLICVLLACQTRHFGLCKFHISSFACFLLIVAIEAYMLHCFYKVCITHNTFSVSPSISNATLKVYHHLTSLKTVYVSLHQTTSSPFHHSHVECVVWRRMKAVSQLDPIRSPTSYVVNLKSLKEFVENCLEVNRILRDVIKLLSSVL